MFFYSAEGVDAAAQRLYIPYLAIAIFVLVLAVVFFFVPLPDMNTEDDYQLDRAPAGRERSIWSHPHFVFAVAAQFFYVAAQAGIFAYFINFIVDDIPPISQAIASSWLINGGVETRDGALYVNELGATKLLGYIGLVLFLLGRFTGAGILARFAPHRVLCLYGCANIAMMLLIFLQLGWVSVAALLLRRRCRVWLALGPNERSRGAR